MATEPSGYYNSCIGKSGETLLKALSTVISSHTDIGYKALWELYKTSDVDENGKIWDMYSTKRWKPGTDQCGTYSSVGDCYNREHSFPKSWFDDASPMVSDGFHIYPTDGYVNGKRGNYPFGECANGTSIGGSGSVRALGRLGTSTFAGYSGTVFEPDDQYKGDFARSYFYMAACYNSRIASFHSDMLAGNSFPVFKSWAVNLLLKWHRQDPVSDKERKRNEVVYGRQHNRNPFIDHPELVEHIWGTQSSTGWNGNTPVTPPEFIEPVNGSTVDLGRTVLSNAVTAAVKVRGTNFTANTSVSVSGSGFSVSPSTLSASAVNAGTSVTVTYRPTAATATSGRLTFTSGNASTSVVLTGEVVSGIPANNATSIGRDAFTANWVNVGNSSTVYTLYVAQNGQQISGYPKTMAAGATSYRVTSLESGATYTYWVTAMGLESNHVNVTTHADLPELNVMPEEDLIFTTTPGTPSRPITITIDAYNLAEDDIYVTVSAPFEVSVDRNNWNKKTTLSVDDDHFYLRVNPSAEGVYYTYVNVECGDFINDELYAQANVSAGEEPFFESFETTITAGYHCENLQQDAASWTMDNAGVFAEDVRVIHSGKQGVRFNTATGGTVMMASSKRQGIGTVSFWTRLWDNDAASLTLEYSSDGGKTWHSAATVAPVSDWTETSVNIDVAGDDMRLRFTKTSGLRVSLDDIRITGYGNSGIDNVMDDVKTITWEAYNLGGELAVDNFGVEDICVSVYGMDGISRFDGVVMPGTVKTVNLVSGVYIVVSGDNSRRVVIR